MARLSVEVTKAPAGLPTIDEPRLRQMVDDILAAAQQLVRGDNEALHAVAPRFIKTYAVDKERRTITVEFYDIPGFHQWNPGTRTEGVDSQGRGAEVFG